MKAATKLAIFTGILALLFAGGALAGQLTDPGAPISAADKAGGHAGEENEMSAMNETAAADAVRGLAVSEDDLRVVVAEPELLRGRTQTVRFRIVDADGETVRDFDVEHTKRMHLIVARRDLSSFQHLHPTMDQDGTWSTPLKLDDAGSYRLFADFSHDDNPTTLATDLRVDGDADLRALPAPSELAKSDRGYDVRLDGAAARAGEEAELRFSISRDGKPVHVEPYLGADGHLVALREGDLAFLHVHPSGHADGAGTDDAVGFETKFPSSGRYRLFLQFKHEGRVQTVAFTAEVA